MAVLTASMISSGPRTGVIRGTKGYMVIENIHNFENLTVYDNSHKRVAFYKRPKQKTGFEYGLKACARALRSNQLECREMPHEQTVSIMNMMDYIRKQLGVIYPSETGVPVSITREEVPTTETADSAASSGSDSEPAAQTFPESASQDDTVVMPRKEDIFVDTANMPEETASDDIGNLEQKIIENARSDAAIAASAAEIMNEDRKPEDR